jgi:hypothetical protein
MNFEDIYCFFRDPPPLYLNQELAVCYILDILLEGDSYGTELIASQILSCTVPSSSWKLLVPLLATGKKLQVAVVPVGCIKLPLNGSAKPRSLPLFGNYIPITILVQ